MTITQSFVSDPPGRGTIELLWQSIFTLYLCLWTVVHLDFIPRSTIQDFGKRFVVKIGVSTLIFLVPEVVLPYVDTEILTSKKIRDLRNKVLDEQSNRERIGSEDRTTVTIVACIAHNNPEIRPQDALSLGVIVPEMTVPASTHGYHEDVLSAELPQPVTSASSRELQHTPSCPVGRKIVGGKQPWRLVHAELFRMNAIMFTFD